ncbi:hypothetical protein HYFRA_00003764 [Hymenoscyphus fraxineus]|uniref:PalH-domain-containing protein n=1 Tax=Hymenoscyphus fraxineus TaxID=746836 RepID=A0A9N9L3K8_9HELO|nr:hypothetical protein HYFRA_00003764 [Hymenoscyphus fraxineus]
MEARQLINIGRLSNTPTPTGTRTRCTPFTLPANGVLTLGPDNVITLTEDAVFRPECTGSSGVVLTNAGVTTSLLDFRDPFYASTIPECYALASATVIAYMLVIMLVITPRTFLHDGTVVLGRRGFTNGPSGSDAGIGIGGRPWLQKVAAMTVAISLTIATVDTFKVAESQYQKGFMDAAALQKEVEDGMELKIIRVISDTFLWLAQAQTLIRLFPRQREKIIIKYTAFALITLDVLFSILNNFYYKGNSRPRTFVDAVPALAYLFQLSLSLLYSAWVIYYAITKKRYSFYHVQMKNMCLVALLSVVSVLVPTVFFVLDISKPTLAGWGDYVRWVGAAAASVVVWEWVERIEALERNDKKDGVLGREVFDGDEMLDVTPTAEPTWTERWSGRKHDNDGDEGGTAATSGSNGKRWPGMAVMKSRYRSHQPNPTVDLEQGQNTADASRNTNHRRSRVRPPLWPTRPRPAATPISRTDTASADSTVYAVRYHPISEATPQPPRIIIPSRSNSVDRPTPRRSPSNPQRTTEVDNEKELVAAEAAESYGIEAGPNKPTAWQSIAKVNPFRRRINAPPPEVSAHTVKLKQEEQPPPSSHDSSNKWDVRGRIEDFAATQADKYREKSRADVTTAPLTRTVIPAPPRRRNLQQTLEELEHAETLNGTGSVPGITSATSQNTMGEFLQVEQPRSSDPYTPDDLGFHAVHQRGAISIVTSDRERSPGQDEGLSPVSPISPEDDRAPSQRNSAIIITPVSPRRDGLPILSIPAPPRRPRRDDDDD